MRDLPDSAKGRSGRCLQDVEAMGDWPLEARTAVYWAIRRRADEAPRWRPRAGAALVGAAALLALAAFPMLGHWSRAPRSPAAPTPAGVAGDSPAWHRVDLAQVGTLELSPAASFELRDGDSELQLHVRGGLLRAQVVRQDPLHPVAVITPHLRVVVVGTRFEVEADASATRVEVLEGKVRVESPSGQSVMLAGGEAIASGDPRLLPALMPQGVTGGGLAPAPEPAPRLHARASARAGATDCSELGSYARTRRCYARQARATGLTSQNALYALAVLSRDIEDDPEQALAYFREYELRFPRGALAPEVALGILETLRERGRPAEAIAAASAFEQRYPTDPRAAEVAMVRAELLCADPSHLLEAQAILEQLQRTGPPQLRAEVSRVRSRCGEPVDPLQPLWMGPPGAISPGD